MKQLFAYKYVELVHWYNEQTQLEYVIAPEEISTVSEEDMREMFHMHFEALVEYAKGLDNFQTIIQEEGVIGTGLYLFKLIDVRRRLERNKEKIALIQEPMSFWNLLKIMKFYWLGKIGL